MTKKNRKVLIEFSEAARYALGELERAFSGVTPPKHYVNPNHCVECAAADRYIAGLDRATLTFDQVGDRTGGDHFSFICDEGFRFFVPALCRLALAEKSIGIPFLIRRLELRIAALPTPGERNAVVEFLDYLRLNGLIESDSDRAQLHRLMASLRERRDAPK